MPAKLILYPPQRAARFLVIRDGETLDVGRDPTCGLVLEDSRVSKRQARLTWNGRGWTLEDLGSKNGTTVNDGPPRGAELQDGDWINFGGLLGRFERLTAAQAASLDSERLARIQTSADLRRRLGAGLEPPDLLLRLLELALEVTAGDRGFVLVIGPDGKLRPEVAAGFTDRDLREERFRGSVGAVKEALESGGPVVIPNALADPRLGKRPSVVTQGISFLACVPLRHAGQLLGVIYVDSRRPSPGSAALASETLEILADHAAAVLGGFYLAQSKEDVPPLGAGLIPQLRERLEELLPTM